MEKRPSSQQSPRSEGAGEHGEQYKGHEILFPRDERRKQIFIDGRPVGFGAVSGEYYLNVYAYDRTKSLIEVVRRYIDYLERTQRLAQEEK